MLLLNLQHCMFVPPLVLLKSFHDSEKQPCFQPRPTSPRRFVMESLYYPENISDEVNKLTSWSHPGPNSWANSVNTCCASILVLHPSKDPAFVAFEGESFGESLLTTSAVVKWDGLAFGAFPGCVARCFTLMSWFLPPRPMKVTIYATPCHHFFSFFLLFQARKKTWDMWGHEG